MNSVSLHTASVGFDAPQAMPKTTPKTAAEGTLQKGQTVVKSKAHYQRKAERHIAKQMGYSNRHELKKDVVNLPAFNKKVGELAAHYEKKAQERVQLSKDKMQVSETKIVDRAPIKGSRECDEDYSSIAEPIIRDLNGDESNGSEMPQGSIKPQNGGVQLTDPRQKELSSKSTGQAQQQDATQAQSKPPSFESLSQLSSTLGANDIVVVDSTTGSFSVVPKGSQTGNETSAVKELVGALKEESTNPTVKMSELRSTCKALSSNKAFVKSVKKDKQLKNEFKEVLKGCTSKAEQKILDSVGELKDDNVKTVEDLADRVINSSKGSTVQTFRSSLNGIVMGRKQIEVCER